MDKKQIILHAFKDWFVGLKNDKNGFPPRGTMGGALVVLEKFKTKRSFAIKDYLTPAGTQISGVGERSVCRILQRYGENRTLVKEGRTNRGLVSAMEEMLKVIEEACLGSFPSEEQNEIVNTMQEVVATKAIEHFNQSGIDFEYYQSKSTYNSIQNILRLAKEKKKDGPVAQHLVGAKLQLRYADRDIENHSYCTADDQLGRLGDFQVEDTIFHVTVRPMEGHYKKCESNLKKGYRVYLLVPDSFIEAARVIVDDLAAGEVSVYSIAGFVGQNIDELSSFTRKGQGDYLYRLLSLYNTRVRAVESDLSIIIDIPDNLEHRG